MMKVYCSEPFFLIRSAAEEDLDKVLEIEQLSFEDFWTHDGLKGALKGLFLVCGRKDIIGYLFACPCKLEKRAEILRIAVHPDHRGKGVAKRLVETSLRIFLKDDIKEVELFVDSKNTSAIKLYERFGFEITKIAPFYHHLEFQISYVLKLNLLELKETSRRLWETLYLKEADYTT
ncbi:MAG: GNAT family N-acetyltransferase [Desulfobacterales bacterium]|uniref:GNAT family N-acetyltransferase n=1 Tax=Candidatus Desulfatibia profunda TaxID=2841695 RepID=A0A8J6NUA5_9BACT|nr:GNAT family N-acetyltransferase [Candidatus Desulfatibia profunda]MBL7180005.1 GNAT family N-acetyltransferase [Desulfobacterales bacterium]